VILIRRRSVVVVALSVLVFTSTVSALSALYEAPSAFAAGDSIVITSSGAPTIFSSRVGMDLVTLLEAMPEVTYVSPEVFAFSSYDGSSFVVRGVEYCRFLPFERGLICDNDMPAIYSVNQSGEALIGERLYDRLGLEVPFVLPLVGSYDHRMQTVEVVAVYRDAGPELPQTPLIDELIVPISVAQALSGVPADEASILRVKSSDQSNLEELLSPHRARFVLYDLSLSKAEIALGDPVDVGVFIRNWGESPGASTITFLDDGVPFHSVEVSLNGSETRLISTRHVPMNSPDNDSQSHVISASASGDFPATVEGEVLVRQPFLKLSVPSLAFLGVSFELSLLNHLGAPVEGAQITVANYGETISYENTTGESGLCTFVIGNEGTFLISVTSLPLEYLGYEVITNSGSIDVVDLSFYPQEFLPSAESFWLAPEVVRESESCYGYLAVSNGGAASGTYEANVTVDGGLYSVVYVALGPLQSRIVQVEISGLEPGTHIVSVSTFSSQVRVEPWFVDDSDLVELVVRYGGSSQLTSGASIPLYQAAKISEGNVAVALIAIGGISALLTALAISSVFAREISESRRTLGIIRSIGASSAIIRKLVFVQSFPLALAGSAIGVFAGVFVAATIIGSDSFVVFGHALSFSVDYRILALAVVGAVGISLVSALASAQVAVRQTVISSIRNLPPEDEPDVDIEELLRE